MPALNHLIRRRRRSGATPVASPAPVNTVAPVISSDVASEYYTGRTLTTTNGTWTNSPTGYTYQWERDGVDIGGATSSTYVLVAADEETAINCTVTASNAGGSTAQDSNSVSVDLVAHLFGSGEVGGWYDIQDTASLWQDTAGTTAAASTDPVGRVDDKSGNGANLLQATSSQRPLHSVDGGGLSYINFDSVDDYLQTSGGGVGISNWTFAAAYQPTANKSVHFMKDTSTHYAGISQSGSSDTNIASGNTLDAHYFDGTSETVANRGDSYTFLQSHNVYMLQGQSSSSMPEYRMGSYSFAGFHDFGDIYAAFYIDRDLTADERAAVVSVLGSKVGVSL